jgi:hypothetical protein
MVLWFSVMGGNGLAGSIVVVKIIHGCPERKIFFRVDDIFCRVNFACTGKKFLLPAKFSCFRLLLMGQLFRFGALSRVSSS